MILKNKGFVITLEAILAMVIMFTFIYTVAGQYKSQSSVETGVGFLEHYNSEILDYALYSKFFQKELDEETPDYSVFETQLGLLVPLELNYRFFVEKNGVKTCIMPSGCTTANMDRNTTTVVDSRYAYSISSSDNANSPKKRNYKLISEVWFDYVV